MVVVGGGQPLQVEDLRLGTAAVQPLEQPDRVQDVEVDDEVTTRVQILQASHRDVAVLAVLGADQHGIGKDREEPAGDRPARPAGRETALLIDHRVVVEETDLDRNRHGEAPSVGEPGGILHSSRLTCARRLTACATELVLRLAHPCA